MENPFDDLTKKLARKALTRRESLRWIGGGFIGAALATLGFGKLLAGEAGHPTCPDYCRSLGLTPGKGNAFGKCVENCAHCREAGGTACGAGSCCFDDAVCCPEGTPGATCVTCGEGEEFDPATCTCVATCCHGEGWICDGNHTIEWCTDNHSCFCGQTFGGETVCVHDGGCGGFASCSSDADCPSGTICVPNTCCGHPICMTPCDCSVGGSAKRSIAPTYDGPTASGGGLNLK